MPASLMLLPTTACPAHCSYCFGPHAPSTCMGIDVVSAVAEWQACSTSPQQVVEIIFHGGEPLAAGNRFFAQVLPLLTHLLAPRQVRFSIQSNLWLLDDSFCELFSTYDVGIGASLDGPQPITDAQRGEGYFAYTWAGIQRAQAHGLRVGIICTFTNRSALLEEEIFSFFMRHELPYHLHPAVNALGGLSVEAAISSQGYASLVLDTFERWLDTEPAVNIPTLAGYCRAVTGSGGVTCTLGGCLGEYLAIAPDGGIYPCQRFVNLPGWELGNILDQPTMEALSQSAGWIRLLERMKQVDIECANCAWLAICRGGCAYQAVAADSVRDPLCPAYQRILERISDRLLEEVFSSENMEAVVDQPGAGKGLLRRGKLIQRVFQSEDNSII